jgi:tetratricopeptide (TPR) repeat protein
VKAAGLGLLFVAGCIGQPAVERAYGDRTVEGRYIGPEAYAAFLGGAIAEGSGDLATALSSYERAARLDPDSPEIWARIGTVRCSADRTDRRADRAFARALELDPLSGRAWTAKARCAGARGDEEAAVAAAKQAAAADPAADEANALVSGRRGSTADGASRRALVALTITARDKVLAWATLASWSEAHDDVALYAQALQELIALDPARRADGILAAERLSAKDHLAEARAVAGASVDAGEVPWPEEAHPLGYRLAIDEALIRRDGDRARERGARVRVSLEEIAARALLLDEPELARQMAGDVARAEPEALGAHLVLAASEGRDVIAVANRVEEGRVTEVSGVSLVVFGTKLVRLVSPDRARHTLAVIPHRSLLRGDERALREARELVACGALDAGVLPK